MKAYSGNFNSPAESIQWIAENILAVADSEFAGEQKLNSINVSFADALPRLHAIQWIAKILLKLDLRLEEPEFLVLLDESLVNIYTHLFNIVSADVLVLARQSQPAATKQQLLGNLRVAVANFYTVCGSRFAVMSQKAVSVSLDNQLEVFRIQTAGVSEDVKIQLRDVISAGEKAVADFNTDFAQRKAELDQATKAVSELAKSAAVSVQAEHFKGLQDEYRSRERRWFWLTVGLIAVAAIYVFVEVRPALKELDKNATTASIVSQTLPRVLIFSAIYFAIVWATRNMAAASHNWVINKHRVAALNTLRAFREASENDKPTRLAILIQVTTAIFSPQATGYLKEEPLPQERAAIEIINRLAGGADGKTGT